MTEKEHNIIHIGMFLGMVILFSITILNSYRGVKEGTETHSDTVYIHHTDTVLKDTIIYRWKRVKDTVYLPADTALLVEQKCYQDSFSTIWISGIEPEIDSIIHFIPRDTVLINTETTTTVVKKKKFGLGVTFGLSAGYGGYYDNGKVGLAPELGISVVIGPTIIIK